MTITFEPTDRIVQVNGQNARIWQGTTDQGVCCHAYILRVAVGIDQYAEAFAAALLETAPLRPDLAGIPARLVG